MVGLIWLRGLLRDRWGRLVGTAAGVAVAVGLLGPAEQAGCALVVATHDPIVADRLRQRWRMVDGRLHTAEVLSWSA